MKVRSEKRKELSQTLLSIVEQVREQSGCLHAGIFQDVENENDYLVVQQWATEKDSVDHLQSDLFTVLRGSGCLMHEPPEIMIHTVSHSSDLKA